MARAKEYYWKGKVKWCRPTHPDPWGNYKTEFYPDATSLSEIKQLKQVDDEGVAGLKNTIKKDEDGEYIALRRPVQKMMKGIVTGMGPVEVLDGTQKLPDGNYAPLRDTAIGNGTDATVKVSVYKHKIPTSPGKYGRAMRWEAIRIDNLVPYEGRKDFTENEAKQIQGMDKVPAPVW